jgi:solute carrier family 26 (sodium-independent sulfate anion transporter), member 11
VIPPTPTREHEEKATTRNKIPVYAWKTTTPCYWDVTEIENMSLNKRLQFTTKLFLKIDHQERYRKQADGLEQRAKRTLNSTYVEDEPTVKEWLRSLVPTRHGAAGYIHNLFPSAQWMPRYNLHWLLGDAIAGLTIGFVVVPQAMAYALLAGLTPEYGLYTSFVGAALYWLFGTSKDIVLGVSVHPV